MAKEKKIVESTKEIIQSFLTENNLELYDIEYVKEGPDRILRVYIDKEEDYIGTAECELVSRFLSEKLDEIDPIDDNYVLEVSSPGLDRVLKTDEHFLKYKGAFIEVSLYKAVDGEKKLTGKLISKTENGLEIDIDGKKMILSPEKIAKVNLTVIV